MFLFKLKGKLGFFIVMFLRKEFPILLANELVEVASLSSRFPANKFYLKLSSLEGVFVYILLISSPVVFLGSDVDGSATFAEFTFRSSFFLVLILSPTTNVLLGKSFFSLGISVVIKSLSPSSLKASSR